MPVGDDQMRDEQTDSLWNRNTGAAVDGILKGKQLDQLVVIVSYARAWNVFHPDSHTMTEVQLSKPENKGTQER